MRRKIIPGNCRRCMNRRKRAVAALRREYKKEFERTVPPPAPPPAPPVSRKGLFYFFRIFKQIGGSR